MKRLSILVMTVLTLACLSFAPVLYDLGEEITVGTTPVEIEFNGMSRTTKTPIYITVDAANSGTIKFQIGATPDASQYAWPAGSKIPWSMRNGQFNLWAVGSGAGQKFIVTAN